MTYWIIAALTSLFVGVAAHTGETPEAEEWRNEGRSFEMWTYVFFLGMAWPFTWLFMLYRMITRA